jgi:hypothetical protein
MTVPRAPILNCHARRKRQQAPHPRKPGLPLTDTYNVLEKLRSGEPLTAKDKQIHERGLVSVLKQLHDQFDQAVLAAYGWQDFADPLAHPRERAGMRVLSESESAVTNTVDETILERLVALNAQPAAEERSGGRGQIHYLRPDFQSLQEGAKAPRHEQQDRAFPERWIVQGYTQAGRFLVVAFELEWLAEWNSWSVYPVNAFEPDRGDLES